MQRSCSGAWLAAVLLLLVSAPRPIRAQTALMQAQAASTVGSIQFPGRMNVSEEALRAALQLKEGQAFSPTAMEADRKALLALGYFRTVTSAQQTANGKTDLAYRLVEWPKVIHIRVLGNTIVDQRAIREAIKTQLGQVLSSRQLLEDIRGIEQLYQDKGYVAHVAQSILDEATKSGILKFDILEVRIGDVVVEGGDRRMQERCRKVLVEVPPELYRPAAVAVDQQRLLRVHGVKDAVAKVETITPDQVRIRWQLNPGMDKSD